MTKILTIHIVRFVRNHAGTSAIEFAIILPVLLMLTLPAFDFGLVYLAKNEFGNVGSQVTRSISIGSMTVSQGKTFAETSLRKYTPVVSITCPTSHGGKWIMTKVKTTVNNVTITGFMREFFNPEVEETSVYILPASLDPQPC